MKKASLKKPGMGKKVSKMGSLMGLKGMPKSPKMPHQSVASLARGGSKSKKIKGGY